MHYLARTLALVSLVCGCNTRDPGDTDSSGDTTPADVCAASAKKEVSCFGGDEVSLAAECEMGLATIEAQLGPVCRERYIEYAMCITNAPCMPEDACDAEESALDCKPEPGPACSAYAAKVAACQPSQGTAEQIGGQCQLEVNAGKSDDPACGAALDAHFACQAEQTCEQLFDSPDCIDEANAIGDACPPVED